MQTVIARLKNCKDFLHSTLSELKKTQTNTQDQKDVLNIAIISLETSYQRIECILEKINKVINKELPNGN